MARYTEAERGRFDAWLICDGVAIAYTDHDIVKTTPDFIYERDYKAVSDFSDEYDLPLDINVWA